MTEENVLNIKMEEGVAYISINRPNQSNSLSRAVFVSLREELEKMAYDDSVRVVVISGEGDKAFCAGIDLKERAKMPKEEIQPYREKVIRTFFNTLGNFPKPTIAAVNGVAFGGGAEVALACDIRVASSTARFAQSEIRWGMIPACGGCQRLRMIVGIGRAKELVFTGRVVEAEEALQMGIFNRVVPPSDFMTEVKKLATEIARNSPLAVRQAKKAIDVGADVSEAFDYEFEVSKACYYAGDAMSGPEKFK
ncbi:putative enoyl-CoA hydratase/isomerase YngF [uncultured Desulfobacterium sp.]|uniref:Putative enoyl-CoA hydratase/isomerase YngF n=1 Tax=uncultured Desulfobacterium sp. TaxID=201089 RepID=A0A445MW82_9BACT|nr:putative enoyl-CoA hydratase/isomerase YngF [uncultured Desulfobacterium sp.]